MSKEWEDYNPYKQEKLAKELGEQFNINRDDFQEADRGSQGNFDHDGFNSAIASAMANDYDTRRAMEAARLSGDYDGPSGISDIGEAYKVNSFMRDTHEENGGGRFSSANDYAGVANHYVDKDRDIVMSSIEGMKDQLLNQALGDKEAETEEKPYVRSDRLQGAVDRLSTAANNPTSLYDKNNNNASASNDQAKGAQNFFFDAKKNLAQGMNLQQKNIDNLSNAAKYLSP